MNTFGFSVLCAVVWISMAKETSPTVQIYSRAPAEVGQPNTLICYLSNFQPPEVTLELLKNGVVMSGGKQSDLVFEQEWQYHLTKTVAFTPEEGAKYSCLVNHAGKSSVHTWDIDE